MDLNYFICAIAFTLVIVGALAWGGIGFFERNFVVEAVGVENSKYVYNAVAISAIVLLVCKAVKHMKSMTGKKKFF